jgi:mono/diheme cytochrome c family protein
MSRARTRAITRGIATAGWVAAGTGSIGGCRTEQTLVTPDPHLERMLVQEKRLAYDPDPVLPKGMAMQQPPSGTMPTSAIAGSPMLAKGIAEGEYARRIPIRVDRAHIEEGRRRFQTFCAACHGVRGEGVSVVAEKMALRKPPSLLDDRVRAFPPGQLFATIQQGYGLMPSYAVQLSPEQAWGVVAYVRALQLSRKALVAELPPDVRARLAQEAR